jgi:hypothetical protein
LKRGRFVFELVALVDVAEELASANTGVALGLDQADLVPGVAGWTDTAVVVVEFVVVVVAEMAERMEVEEG